MSNISFFCENIDFDLKNKKKIQRWIEGVVIDRQKNIEALNYIFCDDDYLHAVNLEYLAHDTLTDIITFDNSEDPEQIEADLFISVERVKENALLFDVKFEDELHRVMIHGVLHLLGYQDKTPEDALIMRQKENECLKTL